MCSERKQILINFDDDGLTGLGNGAVEGIYGAWCLIVGSQDALHTSIRVSGSYIDESAARLEPIGAGRYLATTVVTSIRVMMSSGNIASGTATLYGLVNS